MSKATAGIHDVFWRKALTAKRQYPILDTETGGDFHGQEKGQGREVLNNSNGVAPDEIRATLTGSNR